MLRNIWGWYVKILTLPYRGGWVVWKRPKTPLQKTQILIAHQKEDVDGTKKVQLAAKKKYS
jgi:hypothetical protein